MWELEHSEGSALKEWCFWTGVLEKTLESPLDSKKIKPVNCQQNSPWIFTGRMILKLKLQYFDHQMWRADSLERTLMLGKIEGRRRRRWQRDEMVGQHHWLNGHEFEQTQGDSKGQRSLGCCSARRHKESDMTKGLNKNNSGKNLNLIIAQIFIYL